MKLNTFHAWDFIIQIYDYNVDLAPILNWPVSLSYDKKRKTANEMLYLAFVFLLYQ